MKTVWIFHYDSTAAEKDTETTTLVTRFKQHGIGCAVYQPKNFDIITSRKSHKSIRYQGHKIDLPDAVLVRTGAGTNYFTLALLRQLENFDIPIINNSQSILHSRDKMVSSQILARAKLPTPRTMLVSHPVNVDIVDQEIGFPCVVKLVTGSQGRGVYLCKDKDMFVNFMDLTDKLKSKKTLIIQEFINCGEIFDLRVWVIGGKTVTAMKRTPPEGDFKANISRGGLGERFELTDEISELASKTARAFDLDITGVDLLFNGEKYVVCEANSSPGFEGIDRYCGTDMGEEIVRYVRKRL